MILQADMNELIDKTNSQIVIDVLSSGDPYGNIHDFLEKLTAFSKPYLEETLDFLKTLKSDYLSAVTKISRIKNKTKKDISYDIFKFLSEICPVECQNCKADYTPVKQDYNQDEVYCIICDRTAHNKCYTKENIDEEIGITYICTICADYIKTTKLAKPVELTNLLSQQKVEDIEEDIEVFETVTDSTIHIVGEGEVDAQVEEKVPLEIKTIPSPIQNRSFRVDHVIQSIHTREQNNNRERVEEDEREDCKALTEGTCEFGISGKGCRYKHRKRCDRYCRYGTGKWGCRFGDKCRNHHPKICPNSLNLKMCLDVESCKKVHLVGTKRKIQPETEYHSKEGNFRHSDADQHRRENIYREGRNVFKSNDGERNYGSANKFRDHQSQQRVNPWDNRKIYSREEQDMEKINTDSRGKIQEKESEENLPSKETTMTFLVKCLEEVKIQLQKDMQQQIQQQVNSLMQKQVHTEQQAASVIPAPQYVPNMQPQAFPEMAKFSHQQYLQPVYAQYMPK